MSNDLALLKPRITACKLCADRFAATHSAHQPRPVFWVGDKARILIAGQAPGMRVHESGVPFDDRSGDRLRDWMGITPDQFYNQDKVSILPMAFCFPGYDAKGSDLPPPPICGKTWHRDVLAAIRPPDLILLVGGYAQKWHLGKKIGNVTDTVKDWQSHAPQVFPLPHPSWRNTGWLKKNPWFEDALLPKLQARVESLIG
ncbi:MAG: uracil-DNA glycosylase [Paracoccaceae bacterium]|jgi:uracil-DNA glycosylase